MLRRLAALTVLAAVMALVPAASAPARIVVGQGMAGIRLDMTQAQVRARLGNPPRVVNGSNEFGRFREFRWPGLNVFFQGNRNVTSIESRYPTERTANGAGVGVTEAVLRARLSGEVCRTTAGVRSCIIGLERPGRRVTAFFFSNGGTVDRALVSFVID